MFSIDIPDEIKKLWEEFDKKGKRPPPFNFEQYKSFEEYKEKLVKELNNK